MKKAILFRVVFLFIAMVALGWLPQSALAQRGGHGGGGGFHGGGGGGFHGGGGAAFHGGGGFSGGARSGFARGRSFGGFRGGSFGGRGGFGWGGRYWGRGYGYGWGWGLGFGWPYWGWGWGYPYGYYSPWYYAPDPYYGPSDDPTGYPDPDNGNDDPPPAGPNARPLPNQNGPARPWRPPVPGGAPNAGYANSDVAAVRSRGPVLSVDRMSVTPTDYRAAGSIPAHYTTDRATIERDAPQAGAPLRPEVQKALQRLREMPPFAREREIDTGRYRQFSLEEKQILRNGE
jgi:hypothetical protein